MSTELEKYLDYLNKDKPTTPTLDEPEQEVRPDQPIEYSTIQLPKQPIAREVPLGKTSLTELSQSEEFSKRASRFLEGIGSNENIFEYLRDSDYSLSSAIGRSFDVGNWTDEQKEDYLYLKTAFDNTDLSGFRERFGALKDITIDILGDPVNYLTALFAIPTGGASIAGKAALSTAAQSGIKKFISSNLGKSTLYGASEGMAWGGLHNYFLQDVDIDLGARDEMDITDLAASTALGGVFAGTFGGGARYLRGRKSGEADAPDELVGPEMPERHQQLEFQFSNEDVIDKTYKARSRQQIEKNYERDIATTEQHPEFVGPKNPNLTEEFINDSLEYKGSKSLNWWLAKTIGKSTSEFLEVSKRSPLLQELLKDFRYDYDDKIFGKKRRGVKRDSYGMAVGKRQGRYLYALAKGLNTLDFTGFKAKLAPDQQESINFLLRDRKLTANDIDFFVGKNYLGVNITPDIAASYKNLRNILDETYDDLAAEGLLKTGTMFRKGYFPRIFNKSKLERNRKPFEQMLVKSGHANPLNTAKEIEIKVGDSDTVKGIKADARGTDFETFGVDFLSEAGVKKRDGNNFSLLEDATPAQIRRAKRLKAKAIVDGMIGPEDNPINFALAQKKDFGGVVQPRRFTNIDDQQISQFLENDTQTILQDYFMDAARAIERSRFFGKTVADFQKNRLTPIAKELSDSGLSTSEVQKVINELGGMHERVTGIETHASSPLRKPYVQGFFDWMKVVQQAAHLPFATLSSVTEPFILLSRANAVDSPVVIKDIAVALAKEGASIVDRSAKAVTRAFGGRTKGIKDIDDEAWGELYQTGLALEQAVQERLEGLAGEGIQNNLARTIQAGFFKVNLLTQWTKAVQLASFTTGKRLLRQNAEQLATGKTLLGRKLTKSNRQYLSDQLEDLGLNVEDSIAWYNSSLKNGEFNVNLSKGLDDNGNLLAEGAQGFGNDLFYKTQYIGGANRFTKEIILNPSTAEANRPLWFSTPSGQLLTQFAGYPTVFTNTILKKFATEMKDSPMQAMPKVLPTVLLMTAVAHVGNTIRSSGANLRDYETGKRKDEGDLVYEAVRRWGGLGFWDYAARYDSEQERNVGPIAAISKTFLGPFPQDVIDGILYRKGLTELAVTNLPGYALYDVIGGEGTKKELRRLARGTPDEKPSKLRSFNAKGGIVTNVPNVKSEPDEMQSRITKRPFNSTSEAAQDVEDRELRAQLESLGLREPYVLGGISKALATTVKGASRSGKRLRKNYLDSKYLDTLKPRSKKAAASSEFNVSAKEVHDLLLDGQINIKQAEVLLKDYGYRKETIKKIVRSFKEIDYELGDDFITYT